MEWRYVHRKAHPSRLVRFDMGNGISQVLIEDGTWRDYEGYALLQGDEALIEE